MTHYCRLRVIYNGEEDLQNFYLTDLGKDRIILRYPFMSCFNPRVNWKKGSLSKGKVVIQSAVIRHLDRMVTNWQAKARRQLGEPGNGDAIYARKAIISQKMAHDYHQNKPRIDISIPSEFQRYAKVFSEEEARRFPPDRNPNAVIKRLPGTPEQLNCKVYPLTKRETETLRKFLSEEIDKGYIEETASLYTSPVFFINKKNSVKKRLVVDYRWLNKWTKRDNGPLPRINTILQRMKGKELFSKFNIRWEYNNIPIEPTNGWKAAFKMTIGTYQSNVLSFGMKNAPAQLTRLINWDFKAWKDKWFDNQEEET